MLIQFAKWHGTGNDFILVDDRRSEFPAEDLTVVQRLCDRHFGIGSDGLILIQSPEQAGTAFHMEFFNPDGSKSFCGNGSRCAYAFWCSITSDRSRTRFSAIDGMHEGAWESDLVSVSLNDVHSVEQDDPSTDFIHTGSPHELVWVDDPQKVDLMAEGRKRRYDPKRGAGGTNVNFIQSDGTTVRMRTYERGVEAETLSCGTGVVAAALSALSRDRAKAPVKVITPGGELNVQADPNGNGWKNIRLIGPAMEVFKGSIEI